MTSYAEAGVNIEKGNAFVKSIKELIKSTHNDYVLNELGDFAGTHAIPKTNYVLVSSIDGVGTKTKTASYFNAYEGIGEDLFNHCVNDVMSMGADPLFFLDYMATDTLDLSKMEIIVKGMVRAAINHNCPIIGGETAEMPVIYKNNQIDVAGCMIGIAEYPSLITGEKIKEGDIIIGFPSTGLHTNGYSLVNKLIDEKLIPINEETKKLLMPIHKSYFHELNSVLSCYKYIHGIAHITGGGFNNVLRIIPKGLTAKIKLHSWYIPLVFDLIKTQGKVSNKEMFETFNMGIGMMVIIHSSNLDACLRKIGLDNFYLIGEIVESSKKEIIYNSNAF